MLKYILSFLFLSLFLACGDDNFPDQRREQLVTQPVGMPVDIYRAIADHGTTKSHIAEKNQLLNKLRYVSWTDLSDAQIRHLMGPSSTLTGLDDKIIRIAAQMRRETLIERPSTMSQDIFDEIKKFSGEDKNIREKNQLIPKIATALSKNDALQRRYDIRTACAEFGVFVGLANRIIAILDAQDTRGNSFKCPSGLDIRICDVIEDYQGKDNYIDEKNVIARSVFSATMGPKADRDNAITAVVSRYSALSGLDSKIIGLLPPIVRKLEKPATLDQAIFDIIESFGGKGNFIQQKIAVVGQIDSAIKGAPAKRDAKILNAVSGYTDLNGLAQEIIDLLPPVIPELIQPTGMPDNVFNEIKNFKGVANFVTEKAAVLDPILQALSEPGDQRDLGVKLAVVRYFELNGLAEAIIKLLPIAFIKRPPLVPGNVYDLVKEFDGIDNDRLRKNDVLVILQDILRDAPPELRDLRLHIGLPVMLDSAGRVLYLEIIKLLPPVLRSKPTHRHFTQTIFNEIKNAAGGPDKFIREKNGLIEKIVQALGEDPRQRDKTIQDEAKKTAAFAGLAGRIINLLPAIPPERPASVPQDVFNLIIKHGGQDQLILWKKAFIEKLDVILTANNDDRDDKIIAAVGTRPEFNGLADSIIALLPAKFVKQPAKMPNNVYNQIVAYKDPTAKVKEKNALIKALGDALNADAANREAKIRQALQRADAYFAKTFTDALLAILLSAEYPADDGALPNGIHELIRDSKGGAATYIAEKVAVRNAVKQALDGSPYARDAEIRAAVAKHAMLAGLDAAIIAKLTPVAIPAKPAGMSDDLYRDLLGKTRLDKLLGQQQQSLNRVQEALVTQPNFGPDRDKEIKKRVSDDVKAGFPFIQVELDNFANAAIKIVNEQMPGLLQETESGLVHAVYTVIDGAGLAPFKRNALMKAVFQAINLGVQAQRTAALDKALAEHGAGMANDRKNQLKTQVEAAQNLMGRPAALDNGVYEEIKKLPLSVALKNFVIEQVAAVAAQPERERGQSILKIAQVVNQTADVANKIAGAFPIAAKYTGLILSVTQGSGELGDDKLPKYILVRVTDVGAGGNAAKLNSTLYLHPDRYGKETFDNDKIKYGHYVYFDVIGGVSPDPRAQGLILKVKGYR